MVSRHRNVQIDLLRAAAGLGAPPIEASSACGHRQPTGRQRENWAATVAGLLPTMIPRQGHAIGPISTNSLNPYARQPALIGTTRKDWMNLFALLALRRRF